MEHRPYRSHKVPACIRCRQRKIRCKIDLPGQACLFCREKGVACQIPNPSPDDTTNPAANANSNSTTPGSIPSKRRRYDSEGGQSAISIGAIAENANGKSTIILGPAVAEDVEIIQRHMRHKPSDGASYQTTIEDGGSVVYMTVPKYRRGLQPTNDTGEKQREIVEQIFGPFKKEAIRLFFEQIHPCFPVIGDDIKAQLLSSRWSEVNSALLCQIYGSIVHLWDKSEILRIHPRPSSDYVWNQAVAALQEDSTSPSFPTILNCAINVIGRPSLVWVGNVAHSSRAVAIAHSFGLHRDPRKWNKPVLEKEMRIRTWWCMFIIDSWASLSYGAPPNITKGFYDVPLPDTPISPGGTISNGFHSQNIAMSFQYLCSLSQILAEILPLVYYITPEPTLIVDKLRLSDQMLRVWEEKYPEATRYPPKDNGRSNLHFCYLSVKLLFSRLQLRAAWMQTSQGQPTPAVHDCLVDLQTAATKILEFVSKLTPDRLGEFWLPYTAHLLVVATMILLRCAVETENQATKIACAATLISLKDNLEIHRDSHGWELGELCLERCAELISRVHIASKTAVTPATEEAVGVFSTPGAASGDDVYQFINDTSLMPFDTLGGFDAIDDIWHSLFGPVAHVADGATFPAPPPPPLPRDNSGGL